MVQFLEMGLPHANNQLKKNNFGFSIVEILLVVVVIGILGALFFSTFAAIQRNQHNQERQRDINDVYQQLEAYYVVNSKYPTLADMDSTSWVQSNMKNLSLQSLRDPSSKSYLVVARPEKDAYAYQVSSANGAGCNDTTTPCAHYTLTATLQDDAQKTYVKSSLN